jgi:hypothetical protein
MALKFSCTADCQKQIKLLESIPGNKERGGCDDPVRTAFTRGWIFSWRFLPISHHLKEAKGHPLECEFFSVQDLHKSPFYRGSFQNVSKNVFFIAQTSQPCLFLVLFAFESSRLYLLWNKIYSLWCLHAFKIWRRLAFGFICYWLSFQYISFHQ